MVLRVYSYKFQPQQVSAPFAVSSERMKNFDRGAAKAIIYNYMPIYFEALPTKDILI